MTDLYRAGPLLASLRSEGSSLSAAQRALVCEQLSRTLSDYYVHLPIKQAAFTVDPVQQLNVLGQGLDPQASDLDFLQQVLAIINGLRDRHTTLALPQPWTQRVAYLPVLIEQYWQDGLPAFLLSRRLYGFEDSVAIEGSRVTHWNGTPIETYVRRVLAPQSQGANPSAMQTMAIANLTIRPLAYSLPPDEDWVQLDLIAPDGRHHQLRLDWKYFVEPPQAQANSLSAGAAMRLDVGLDVRLQQINRHVFQMFAAHRTPLLARADGLGLRWLGRLETGAWGIASTPTGDVGYVRLFSFEVSDVAQFLMQMAEVLATLPQDRLLLDIRNNPGGVIPAGEGLVQMLCPRPIEVAPVTFRNTLATRHFGQLAEFAPWRKSLDLMSVSAETYAQLFPLTDPALAPAYRYPGRTALIVDAASYSTCDYVAADFKDNHVGLLIGTTATTGAGGANVWSYELLRQYVAASGAAPLAELPPGMQLNVAMRRAVRTGSAAGLPIENFGVPVDRQLPISRVDLLEDNFDLICRAAALL